MILLPLIVSIVLTQADKIEVPFRMGENAIIVDATVNGHPLSLMFDSGFSGTLVADENLNLGVPDHTIGLRDFVGQFQAKAVKINSFRLGGLDAKLSDPEAVEQPISHMSEAYNAHTDGIMGFSVIENQVTEINFQNHKFIFYPKSYDITQKTPDNKKTFLLKMLPIGSNSVEMPVVTPNGTKLIFALDTGNAFYATTHRDVLEKAGLWDSAKTPKYMSESFVASGPVNTWQKKLDGMTIFGVPVPTSYWDIIDLPAADTQGDGTIGIQFLHNFNITIDFERRRVFLENFSGQVGNDPPGGIGVVAEGDRRSGAVLILEVSPESAAEKAGLKVGDRILEIDGKETSPNMTIRQVDARLKGNVGSKVSIAVSRDGALTRYDLERSALFND